MTKLSKPIAKLLTDLGFNIRKLPDNFKRTIQGSEEAKKRDFEFTLTSDNDNYINRVLEKVPVKNIIGTTSKKESITLLDYVSELYTDKHEYGRRSLVYLNGSIPDNIDSINRQRPEQAIKAIKINNKYYVNRDGNHRAFYLLFTYCIQTEKYKEKPRLLEETEEKFKVKMLVNKVSDYNLINKVCYCLIKTNNQNIRMTFTPNEEYIGVLQINREKYEISSEEHFIHHFSEYLNSLDKNDRKYQLLLLWLLKVNYFDEELVKNINNLNDDDILLESISRKK